jgi:ABC-type nitrate/sulfonate/bicarbonate transport system substrate-binding protein
VAEYYPRYQWGIILADERWLRRQRGLAARLMHAFRQACRSIKERPADTITLGSRVFGVSCEVFEIALQRDLLRWQTDARLDMTGLQTALSLQEAMGLLTTGLRVDEMILQL